MIFHVSPGKHPKIAAIRQKHAMPTLHISSQFDAGAIQVQSLADPQTIQLNIRPDNASEFAQWFYFCLHGAMGVPIEHQLHERRSMHLPQGLGWLPRGLQP
jgi:hypothetical protein